MATQLCFQSPVTAANCHPIYNLGVSLHDFLFDPPQPSGQCTYHRSNTVVLALCVANTQPSYPCTVLTDLSAFSVRHKLTLYVNVDSLGHTVAVNITILIRGPSELSVGTCKQGNALLDTGRALDRKVLSHCL